MLSDQVLQASMLQADLEKIQCKYADALVQASEATASSDALEAALAEKDAKLAAMQMELSSLQERHQSTLPDAPSEGVPGEDCATTTRDEDDASASSERAFSSDMVALQQSHEAAMASLQASHQRELDERSAMTQPDGTEQQLSVDLAAAVAQLRERDEEMSVATQATEMHAARIGDLESEMQKMMKTHTQEMAKLKEKYNAKYKDKMQEKKEKMDAKLASQKQKSEARIASLAKELDTARLDAAEASKQAADVVVQHCAAATIQRSYRQRTTTNDLRVMMQASSAKFATTAAKLDMLQSVQTSSSAVETEHVAELRAEIERTQSELAAALAAAETQESQFSDMLANLSAGKARAIADLKQEIASLKAAHAAQTGDDAAQSAVDGTSAVISEIEERLHREMDDLRSAHALALEEVAADHAEKLRDVVESNRAEKDLLVSTHESELQSAVEEKDSAVMSAEASHAQRMDELRAAHAAELECLQAGGGTDEATDGNQMAKLLQDLAGARESQDALAKELEETRAHLRGLESEHDRALAAAAEKHSAELAVLTEAAATEKSLAEHAVAQAESLRVAAMQQHSAATSAAAEATGGVYKAVELEVQQLRDAHLSEIEALRSSTAKREALTESRHAREVSQLQQAVERLEAAGGEQAVAQQHRQQIDEVKAAHKLEVVNLNHRVSISMTQLASARQELAEARAALLATDQTPHPAGEAETVAAQVVAMKRVFAQKHAAMILSLEESQQAAICEERAAREAAEASSARTLAELTRLRRQTAVTEEPKRPPTSSTASSPPVEGSASGSGSTGGGEGGFGVVDAVPASHWQPGVAAAAGVGIDFQQIDSSSHVAAAAADTTGTEMADVSMRHHDQLTLAIRTGSGTYKRFTTRSAEQVGAVKQQAASLLGVPAAGRVLVFNYRILDDSLTLSEWGVWDKGVVRLEVQRKSQKNVIISSLKKSGGGGS